MVDLGKSVKVRLAGDQVTEYFARFNTPGLGIKWLGRYLYRTISCELGWNILYEGKSLRNLWNATSHKCHQRVNRQRDWYVGCSCEGLTYRIGRHIQASSQIISDLVHEVGQGGSLLLGTTSPHSQWDRPALGKQRCYATLHRL